MKNNEEIKSVRLDMMRDGAKFKIVGLEDWMFRDLKLVSTSDCSSLIEGFKRDSKEEPWKPFRYHVSNSVRVIPDESKYTMSEPKQKHKETPTSFEKRGRGRPKKEKMLFKDLRRNSEEFTVKDIMQENPDVKSYEINSLIKEGLDSDSIKLVGEKKGKRGKPQKVYRLI
jgi:hypothetical protein